MKKHLLLLLLLITPLQINEILPNPTGQDKGAEWLELYNNTDSDIDLSGWRLSNNKTHYLSGIIKAKSTMLLNNLKISLRNTDESITLYKDSEAVDNVTYPKAIEGLSFSRIKITNGKNSKSDWTWTTPTPDSTNPTLHEFKSIITAPPQIGNDFYFEIPEGKIVFDEPNFSFEKLSTVLTKDTELFLLIEKAGNHYILHDFQIIFSEKPQAAKKSEKINYFFVPLIFTFPILIYLYRRS